MCESGKCMWGGGDVLDGINPAKQISDTNWWMK